MKDSSRKQKTPICRAIAFYLPQFYPIPENDSFWGKGFTEWTNVTKAKPLFSRHYQPFLPSDLGLYDLRIHEVREEQAKLARAAGVEGFCYWHYWFGNGKRVLDRVFNEVLTAGRPDFPFCLAWANQDWTGKWHGLNDKYIFKQEYPDCYDIENHFYAVLSAFKDERYIRVHNKPLFVIYKHNDLPCDYPLIPIWRKLARREGLEGIYFISNQGHIPSACHDFDGYAENGVHEAAQAAKTYIQTNVRFARVVARITNRSISHILATINSPMRLSYRRYAKYYKPNANSGFYSTILPGWDNTPRANRNGLAFINESPKLFEKILSSSVEVLQSRVYQERLLFLKSWNEWAEGNVLEPSAKWGSAYTDILRKVLFEACDK